MSTSKLARTGSDSWSMMPTTAQEGLTETATAGAGPTPCETYDAVTHTNISARVSEHGSAESEAAADAVAVDDGEASEDSWVEVTAAELESPCQEPPATTEAEAAAAAEAEAAVHTEKDPSLLLADTQPVQEDVAAPPAEIEGAAPAPVPLSTTTTTTTTTTLDSATLLRRPEVDEELPATAEAPTMDLAEFLAGLTLSKAYEAAMKSEAPVSPREAAARALASFDADDTTDDFTNLAAEEREMEETVDLECMPSSTSGGRVTARLHAATPATASTGSKAPTPTPTASASTAARGAGATTGTTAVLRRRMVAEDWLRTLRGPSELTPQERVEVFQALFGDTGDAPISAERFREMMVPYERHCECLGASYGFHHQGCQYYPGNELTS